MSVWTHHKTKAFKNKCSQNIPPPSSLFWWRDLSTCTRQKICRWWRSLRWFCRELAVCAIVNVVSFSSNPSLFCTVVAEISLSLSLSIVARSPAIDLARVVRSYNRAIWVMSSSFLDLLPLLGGIHYKPIIWSAALLVFLSCLYPYRLWHAYTTHTISCK